MSTPVEKNDTQERLSVLKRLLREGAASTQEELCEALARQHFDVTQSTVSRDLRRIGAIKATNSEGETIYRLPENHQSLPPQVSHSLVGLVNDIMSNENMIVIHSTPGSASLVARHIDSLRENMGIIGTIAGDDTVLIVPASVKKIASVIRGIKEEFF